ncbi:hypothetical protein AUEXF2481DRAFT_78130 [Aureobasidium subglaciale EXF-2481]|uniref:DNA2/NAM7 helicase-like C-terminal domain-containing protein n=1 Tax=Aureobasidium subglaciale (strain EXF-2481) TaxID=1043005 RepID=A0A074YHP4_AURSE|nr:uncharacterized protein AUEXF2481DRAFT_78130 [Aureobasidium subglaciale EXF-2481]KAI5205999.1 hypothetical protein E4T38_04052 [Aureobasidium subglaciale]KAI5224820.1 hypothetical protein E4T40_03827 [Aureobasidium subglaciale]KAI5227911.1 hypothetical protein E4T41_04047 [Aureobasidium subglaciale]KAI5263537.1 hypothetical protein E4T46_03668 [Aureobasidium subglaciale]KEQ97338.1 hypothetical protein AUEXF2481DRAFT_78130 [Aureobasidium subglaciale EXF-2481]
MSPPRYRHIASNKVNGLLASLKIAPITNSPQGPKAVTWAIAVAMHPREHVNPSVKFDFNDPECRVVRDQTELQSFLPDTALPLAIQTSADIILDWNKAHPKNKYSLHLSDGRNWRVVEAHHKWDVTPIFIRLINDRWEGYALSSMQTESEQTGSKQTGSEQTGEKKLSRQDVIRATLGLAPDVPIPPFAYALYPEHAPVDGWAGEETIPDFSVREEIVEVTAPDPRAVRKATDKIQSGDKLVVLNNFKHGSKEDEQTNNCYKSAATLSVEFDDGTIIGPVPDAEGKAGLLDFSVELLGLAPTIILELTFPSQESHATGARCRVEFAFNTTNIISDKELKTRQEISDFDMFTNDEGALITFKSEGCRAHDVFCYTEYAYHERQVIPRGRLAPQQRWALNTFKRLAQLTPGQSCTIKLNVLEGLVAAEAKRNSKKTQLQFLSEKLPSKQYGRAFPQFTGPAYMTYRNPQGVISLQYNQQVSRKTALRPPHPGASIPARMLVRDNDELALHLSIGADLLHKEQAMHITSVSEKEHFLALVPAGNYAVACIKYREPLASGIPDLTNEEKITIPVDTQLKLTIYGDHKDKQKWHCVALVGVDVYGFGCDLFAVITDKVSSEFKAILSEAGSAGPKILNVHIDPIISDVTTKHGIDAVASALSIANKPDNPNYVPAMFLWPFVYQGEPLERKQVFKTAFDRDIQHTVAAFKYLRNSEPWDKHQFRTVDALPNPFGGVNLVAGAAGTGKTLVMGRFAQFSTIVGSKVLIVGMINSSLDDIALKIDEKMSEDVASGKVQKMDNSRPIRAYSARLESPLQPSVDRTQADIDAEDKQALAHYLAWKSVEETYKNKRRALPDYSVEAKMNENLNDASRPPLMAHYTDGIDDEKKPIPDGPLVNMYEELKKYMARIAQPAYADFFDAEKWSDEEKRKFRQSLKICRYEVYQQALIVFCTCPVAATREMAEFASDAEDEIVMFADEATTIGEVNILIPFKTKYAHKIKGIYQFGDPRQLGPNPIAATGKDNTVNEFLAQHRASWFVRLLHNGFPVYHLPQQKRQHKLLNIPVNEVHYQKSNLTDDPRLHADLGPEDENLLIDFLPLQRMPHEQFTRRYAHVIIRDSILVHPPGSNSSQNHPHIVWVLQKYRLEVLKTHFGTKTQLKCLIQVPYRAQLNAYEAQISIYQQEWNWSREMFPAVKTIDGGIGGEAEFVINDVVRDESEGFLQSAQRTCVMASRAKNFQVIVIGPMDKLDRDEKTVMTKFADKGKPNHAYKVRRPLAHHEAYANAHNALYFFNSDSNT